MQDRYVGDVGDFGKLGLLRIISKFGLRIGVNWYLTYKPEEHINADGKHIGYFNNDSFKDCDNELLKSLYVITKGTRSVEALEDANLISNAIYYKRILKPGSDKYFNRIEWHSEALEELSESDIIFCDPDNGLIVKSVSRNSNKSDKYILHDELVSYYQAGKSIVFYNHRSREQEQIYLQRFQPLMQRLELVGSEWRGLKFTRGTIRDYIFILQPKHTDAVDMAISNMIESNWRKHFSILNI
ncbi:MAG: hypothetical protein GX129_01885 [Clostridiales bacterium]|jgi:hypothetical protein|nr:hypothetical protein [Clostridiales bacterium]